MKTGWKENFIRSLAETGNATKAAQAAGITRTHAFDERKTDTDFAALWEAALDEAADGLEAEARRRAVEGVDKPVFFMGERRGAIRVYSDSLLTLLLKAAKPEKYRERIDTTSGGAPSNHALAEAIAQIGTMDADALVRLHQETLGA